MERPSCGNCLHFHKSSEDGKGECHGVTPTVLTVKNEVKTVFPEVRAEHPGCPNHKDIVTFEAAQSAGAATAKQVASGLREDGQPHLRPEQIRQKYPCHCIRLGPTPDNRHRRVRLTIPGDTRIITALRTCVSCGGTGRPTTAMLAGVPAAAAKPAPKPARDASDIPFATDVPELTDAERMDLLQEAGEIEIPDPEVDGEQILGDDNEPLPGKDWA